MTRAGAAAASRFLAWRYETPLGTQLARLHAMTSSLRASFLVLPLLTLVHSSLAYADMPGGGGDECEAKAGCVECTRVVGDELAADYDACVADAEADGLSLSCTEPQGVTDAQTPSPEGHGLGYGAGTVIWPTGRSSSTESRCARVSAQRNGASSR